MKVKYKKGGKAHSLTIPSSIWYDYVKSWTTKDRYALRMGAIQGYVNLKTGLKDLDFRIVLDREDAIRYALDQGTAIVYKEEEGLTTKEEQEKGTGRYVEPEAVEFWMGRSGEDKDRVLFAVIADMDLVDFDEWCAIAKATGIKNIILDDSYEINQILWERYTTSPMESPAVGSSQGEGIPAKELGTVKALFGVDDMSAEDEKRIYDILLKYGKPCVSVSKEAAA